MRIIGTIKLVVPFYQMSRDFCVKILPLSLSFSLCPLVPPPPRVVVGVVSPYLPCPFCTLNTRLVGFVNSSEALGLLIRDFHDPITVGKDASVLVLSGQSELDSIESALYPSLTGCP